MASNSECTDVDALDLLELQLMFWNGAAVSEVEIQPCSSKGGTRVPPTTPPSSWGFSQPGTICIY